MVHRLIKLVLCLFAAAASCAAGTTRNATDSLLDLPADADLALVILRGDTLIDGPIGDAASVLLADAAAPATRVAQLIAESLGLETKQFVKLLIRERFVFVARVGENQRHTWAISFDTTQADHALLRDTLFSKPRGALRGRPAYDLGNGAFRATTTTIQTRHGTRIRTYLAPAKSPLLEDLLKAHAGDPGLQTFRSSEHAETIELIRENSFALVATRPAVDSIRAATLGRAVPPKALPANQDNTPRANQPDPPGLALTVIANATPSTLTGTLVAHADVVLGLPNNDLNIRPWPLSTYNRLADGATFAVIEHESLGLGIARTAIDTLTSPPRQQREGTPLSKRTEQGPGHPIANDPRFVVALYPPAPGATAPEVFVAREVSDVTQASIQADAALSARFGATNPQQPADPITADSPDRPIADPAAVRSIDLAPVLGPFSTIAYGQHQPSVNWTVRRSPRAEALDPQSAPGWWTVAIGTDQPRFFDLTALLTGERDDVKALPWVSIGTMQPSTLLSTSRQAGNLPVLDLAQSDAGPLLQAFERTRTVNWRLLRSTNGLVIGGFGIEYTTPNDPTPAQATPQN